MRWFSWIRMAKRATSPHAASPDSPMPLGVSNSPTLRGLTRCSITCGLYSSISPQRSARVQGREFAQSRDGSGEGFCKALNLLNRIIFSDGDSDGRERLPLRAAHREQNRRRFVTSSARGARRSASDGIPEGIQEEHEALGLDTLDREVCVVGEPLFAVAVEAHGGYAGQTREQSVP